MEWGVGVYDSINGEVWGEELPLPRIFVQFLGLRMHALVHSLPR